MRNYPSLQLLVDLHLKTKTAIDQFRVQLRTKTVKLTTYVHSGIESSKPHTHVLCTLIIVLNTALQLRLKNFLGFSREHSFFALSRGLDLKRKKRLMSTQKLNKSEKKLQTDYFFLRD